MTAKSALQAKMIESLGGPLLAAITASGGEAAAGRTAATMAELLNRSVQLGISLAKSLDLQGPDDQADAIRLALTALAGSMVAALYRQSGQVPGDGDLRRLQPALEAVLTLSDNFAPSAEALPRLEALDPGALPVDAHQVTMQFVQAFVPAVAEIGAYSFGRQDRKLMQDVAERLRERAFLMRQTLFPGAEDLRARSLELGLMKALVQIYAECHRNEKTRLGTIDEAERAAMTGPGGLLQLDRLWTVFDERAAMLEVVAVALFGAPGSAGSAAAGLAPQRPEPAISAPAAVPQPVPQQVIEVIDQSTQTERPASPMGFFKPGVKKPVTGENSDSGAGQ
jgi:hypothetical protein